MCGAGTATVDKKVDIAVRASLSTPSVGISASAAGKRSMADLRERGVFNI
jgi:hypothetical protein